MKGKERSQSQLANKNEDILETFLTSEALVKRTATSFNYLGGSGGGGGCSWKAMCIFWDILYSSLMQWACNVHIYQKVNFILFQLCAVFGGIFIDI